MRFNIDQINTFEARAQFVTANLQAIWAQGLESLAPEVEVDESPANLDAERAQRLADCFPHTSFGCQNNSVRELFEIMVGQALPNPGTSANEETSSTWDAERTLYPWTVYKKVEDNHDDLFGLVIGVSRHKILGGGGVTNGSGWFRNMTELPTGVTVATPEEVTEFFVQLKASNPMALAGYHGISNPPEEHCSGRPLIQLDALMAKMTPETPETPAEEGGAE